MFVCILTILFCHQGLVMSSLDCMDWQGKTISDGMTFYPNKNDPCLLCLCERGYSTMCKTVSCAPPNCPNWKSIPGECCEFACLDKNGVPTKMENTTYSPNGGDVSGKPTENTVTDLGLRLVASTVTTFLILALLLFLIHRFRQRRLLMTLRRYSRRHEPMDDLDSMSYSPDFFGIQCPPYEDPPPPYTPPKPQPGEEPPPYDEAVQCNHGDNDTGNTQQNGLINRDQNSNTVNSGNTNGAGFHGVFHGVNRSSGAADSNGSDENGNRSLPGNNNSINGNSYNGNSHSGNSNLGNSNMSNRGNVRLHRDVSDGTFDCRIANNSLQQSSGNTHVLDSTNLTSDNPLSVHFRNNLFAHPSITMGVQNRNRNHRNRYSDGNFNLNSARNMSNRLASAEVNENTEALNLELRNTVRNFRNRTAQSTNRHSVPNTGDLSSSTTDIGESSTSAESLSSSPETPHFNLESRNQDESPEVLPDDANSTVQRFLNRQFGVGQVPKNSRRYPTTMSQSWTSAQVSPTGQNFRQSISLGSFSPKQESQPAQRNSCLLPAANGIGNNKLPRSKSEHLKTNGSLINQPYKSPTRNSSHAGHAVRVAYKEPDELDHSYMHNRNSCDLNTHCRDSNSVDSNASVCSGQIGNNATRLSSAILDPGDIIVTRRHDELRKLRLSHLLNKQTGSYDSTNIDFNSISTPRHLQRSFSDHSVNSMSVCSETGERSGAGLALSNDAPYPTSSYKTFQKPSTMVKQVDNTQFVPNEPSATDSIFKSSNHSSPSQRSSISQHSRSSQCQSVSQSTPQGGTENTPRKDIMTDRSVGSSSASETSSYRSSSRNEGSRTDTRRKLPDISMIRSWHGGQLESCDDNSSLSRLSMNTIGRNSNKNFDKKVCMDKDVSNMFFPYYKPCNTNIEIDKNGVPSSEMRACASQLYNYETEERPGKKGKKKQLFKRHSSGCMPVQSTELKSHSPRSVQKQYQRVKSSRSNERQTSQKVPESSCKDHSRKQMSSKDRKSSKRLLPSKESSAVPVTDLTTGHCVQSHNSPGRPNSLNITRNENTELFVVPLSNPHNSFRKKRSKSLGRGETICCSSRHQGSQLRKKKRQSAPVIDPFQAELEHALRQKSQVKSPVARNGSDRNHVAMTQV